MHQAEQGSANRFVCERPSIMCERPSIMQMYCVSTGSGPGCAVFLIRPGYQSGQVALRAVPIALRAVPMAACPAWHCRRRYLRPAWVQESQHVQGGVPVCSTGDHSCASHTACAALLDWRLLHERLRLHCSSPCTSCTGVFVGLVCTFTSRYISLFISR